MPIKLVMKNLMAHPLRASLTLCTLAVAVFLLCFLQALLLALNAGVEGASSSRLIVQSAVSLFVDLPLAYQSKIESISGVEQVCKLQYFGGIYQEPSNYFAQFAVDADRLFLCYPEIEMIEGTIEDFQKERASCVVGRQLANRFGWKVGSTVPLFGTIFQRTDGANWEFQVAGIFRSTVSGAVDEGTLYFHYDYLRESLETGGAEGPEGVGVFTLRLAPGANATTIMATVDDEFKNGPQRVQTTTEAEFTRQFVSMLGSVPTFLSAIGGGVLFAIALAALNTMLMAGRERVHQIGIMKALGFSNGVVAALLLVESVFLCGAGGVVGLAVVKFFEPIFANFMSSQFPGFAISNQTMVTGLGAALAIGVLAGIVPARNASQLRPVEALRMEA